MDKPIVAHGRIADPRRIDFDTPLRGLTGRVEVILRPESPVPEGNGADIFQFIASLPPGRRSKAEIDRELEDARNGWGSR